MAKIMQRTVFVDHEGERVRLVRGQEAPDWYDGDLAGDELGDVRGTIPTPVGNHPAVVRTALPQTEGQAEAGVVTDDMVAGLDALTEDELKSLEALSDDQRAELATLAAPQEAQEGGDGGEVQTEGEQENAQEGAQEPGTEAAGGEPGTTPPTDAELIDGSVDDVLERVGDDQALIRQALDAEKASEKPRSTLIEQLTKRAGQ